MILCMTGLAVGNLYNSRYSGVNFSYISSNILLQEMLHRNVNTVVIGWGVERTDSVFPKLSSFSTSMRKSISSNSLNKQELLLGLHCIYYASLCCSSVHFVTSCDPDLPLEKPRVLTVVHFYEVKHVLRCESVIISLMFQVKGFGFTSSKRCPDDPPYGLDPVIHVCLGVCHE